MDPLFVIAIAVFFLVFGIALILVLYEAVPIQNQWAIPVFGAGMFGLILLFVVDVQDGQLLDWSVGQLLIFLWLVAGFLLATFFLISEK